MAGVIANPFGPGEMVDKAVFEFDIYQEYEEANTVSLMAMVHGLGVFMVNICSCPCIISNSVTIYFLSPAFDRTNKIGFKTGNAYQNNRVYLANRLCNNFTQLSTFFSFEHGLLRFLYLYCEKRASKIHLLNLN